jgi:hypothetical protein
MSLYYLSKNYKEIHSAGNKAKTDIESIPLHSLQPPCCHLEGSRLAPFIMENKIGICIGSLQELDSILQLSEGYYLMKALEELTS